MGDLETFASADATRGRVMMLQALRLSFIQFDISILPVHCTAISTVLHWQYDYTL